MVFKHDTMEKSKTWGKPFFRFFQFHCPRKCSFSPKVASSKVQPIKVLNANKHMLQSLSLLNLVQARCCLKRTPAPGYATDTLFLLDVALLMVYRRISRFWLSPAAKHSASDSSHSGHEPNLSIIRTILPRRHHRMCIPHSPCHSAIDSSSLITDVRSFSRDHRFMIVIPKWAWLSRKNRGFFCKWLRIHSIQFFFDGNHLCKVPCCNLFFIWESMRWKTCQDSAGVGNSHKCKGLLLPVQFRLGGTEPFGSVKFNTRTYGEWKGTSRTNVGTLAWFSSYSPDKA